MKLIKKIAAVMLLTIGLPFSIVTIVDIFNPKASDKQKEESLIVLVFIGAPCTISGGFLLWRLRQQNQKEISDRLQDIFFQLIKENQGNITVLRFAMETKLSGEAAKKYLDGQVKEFNGTLEVSDRGDISYQFDI